MGYKRLQELRNQYPTERDVNQSYEYTDNSINYNGRFDENSLTFSIQDVTELITYADTSFQFILQIDNNEYTSPSFKTLLQNSLKDGNPYIQKSTVAKIQLTSEELLNSQNFQTRELYSEVEITKNLKTIEDIVRHIDWLVSSRQTLREIGEYGEYNLFTTQYDPQTDTGIGLEYSDAVQSGTEYVASDVEVTNQNTDNRKVDVTVNTQTTVNVLDNGTYNPRVKIPIRYTNTNPFTNINFSL